MYRQYRGDYKLLSFTGNPYRDKFLYRKILEKKYRKQKAFGDILVKIHEKTEELDQSKKRHEKQLEATEYVLRNVLNIPELPRTLNDTEKQLAAADQEKRDLLSKSIFEKLPNNRKWKNTIN